MAPRRVSAVSPRSLVGPPGPAGARSKVDPRTAGRSGRPIEVAVSRETRALLETIADAAGLSLAETVRRCCVRGAASYAMERDTHGPARAVKHGPAAAEANAIVDAALAGTGPEEAAP